MSLVNVSGISVEEDGNVVIEDVSFIQQGGKKLVIAGETGSGKSTLLQTVAGLVQPSKGHIAYKGNKVKGPHDVLVPGHQEIAYLSQQFELPPFLRVEQILRYSNTLTSEEASLLYEVCKISHLLHRKTNQLSGGERQRIALAKLLVSSPGLLLLDEPFSNLDLAHKAILKSIIEDIRERLEITCMLISHDPMDTLPWADEILVMQHGRIVQTGTPDEIYRQPISVYVASLFGSYNLIPASSINLFDPFSKVELTDLPYIVRPEDFDIVSANDKYCEGTAVDVKFFGSHYEIAVKINELLLTIRTEQRNIIKGDKFCLSLKGKTDYKLLHDFKM